MLSVGRHPALLNMFQFFTEATDAFVGNQPFESSGGGYPTPA